ncbi:MAG: hypothetical protein UX70_C0001G0791 [Candidatus Wolfebacteria bacterium GW2011_GWB1_47_1]|nr:MAG: hypothetical protein UX70_C0001G0791 [Candidatus Wolfebacteria bacterium GW2011_GWB1_47_1]
MTLIYGIDTTQPITPRMVRDAIIECFHQAHDEELRNRTVDEQVNRSFCAAIVEKAFLDIGADFQNPTKEDLLRVIEQLAVFTIQFRDPLIVDRHIAEIRQLIDKLP